MVNYTLINRKELSEEQYPQVMTLGKRYEKDIGGVDLGFGSLVNLSDHLFLIEDEKKVVGFILGGSSIHSSFDGEKSFWPAAVYIAPEYRNKTGNHKDVFKNSLKGLVNLLDENKFDRLKLFPDFPGLITDFGHEYVLKNLHEILYDRSNQMKGAYINYGENGEFNPHYIFRLEEFEQKIKQRRN